MSVLENVTIQLLYLAGVQEMVATGNCAWRVGLSRGGERKKRNAKSPKGNVFFKHVTTLCARQTSSRQ